MTATEANRMADQAELTYWRTMHADIMHRRDHSYGDTLHERICRIRQITYDHYMETAK
jgi:hypothetical protein